MSNTVRTIAFVALLILLTAPAVVPMARASAAFDRVDGPLARGPAQDPDGAPMRGPAQDPDGMPLRGPAQAPNGGRPDRSEWGGSVASGLSQQVVMARLLSV